MNEYEEERRKRDRKLKKKAYKEIDAASIPEQISFFLKCVGTIIGCVDLCAKSSEFLEQAELTPVEQHQWRSGTRDLYMICRKVVDSFHKAREEQ